MPLHVSKVPCLMRYRSLNIGVGSGNTLDLSKYGHCNFVSARHATIYFDQFSQVYELINYSEHGTIVDNTVYALNCDAGAADAAEGPAKSKRSAKQSAPAASKDWLRMSTCAESGGACHCGETSAAMMLRGRSGCENSAVLHHGSYIRMGCFQFVFSIMDYLGGVDGDDKAVKTEPKTTAEASKDAAEAPKTEHDGIAISNPIAASPN